MVLLLVFFFVTELFQVVSLASDGPMTGVFRSQFVALSVTGRRRRAFQLPIQASIPFFCQEGQKSMSRAPAPNQEEEVLLSGILSKQGRGNSKKGSYFFKNSAKKSFVE